MKENQKKRKLDGMESSKSKSDAHCIYVQEMTPVLTATFLKTSKQKMVDRSGQPEERNSSSAQTRTLLEEQRQMIIAEYREKVGHHELHAAHAEEERRLLQGQLWRQKMELREVHQESLTEMEELRKFQSSTFHTMARRKLIEDQNTILELSRRLQELHNEVNCMNDSKDFQDAESVRSGNSHVTSRPVSFPPHPIPEGMLRQAFVSPRRKEGPQRRAAKHFGTHMVYRKTFFANPVASSSALYPQELNQWNSSTEEPFHPSEIGVFLHQFLNLRNENLLSTPERQCT